MFRLSRQFLRYVRSVRPQIFLGLFFMLASSLLAGANIGMIYPFFEGVFLRGTAGGAGDVPAMEALGALLREVAALPGSGGIEAMRAGAGAALENYFASQSSLQVLLTLCFVALGLASSKLLIHYAYRVCFIHVEQTLIRELRNDLFRSVQKLGMDLLVDFRGGEVISRVVNDVMVVRNLTITKVSDLLLNLIQSLVYFLLALVIDWRLTLLSIFVLAPAVASLNLIGQKLRKYSRRAQEHLSAVTTRLAENLAGFRVVQAFHAHDREVGRFEEATRGYFRRVRKLEFVSALSAPFGEWASTLVAVCMLWVGGTRVLSPEASLSPAAFLTFLAALLSMLHPLKVVARAWNELQKGTGAGERLLEILDREPLVKDPPRPKDLPQQPAEWTLQGVTHAFGESEALKGVDLRVERGEFIALVGASGSGKTTLANLLLRLQDPTKGRVTADGVDARETALAAWRGQFGVVSQETFLFRLSVAGNVAYPDIQPDMERVTQVLEQANAADFVAEMGGPEALVEEGGSNLSGGQRQRLAIARALYRRPQLLVLDEATSALDTESEQQVQAALDRSLGERTSVVIAHRLSTIIRADRIVCLKEGRIAGSGPHAELLESCAEYRKLYELQYRHTQSPVEESE